MIITEPLLDCLGVIAFIVFVVWYIAQSPRFGLLILITYVALAIASEIAGNWAILGFGGCWLTIGLIFTPIFLDDLPDWSRWTSKPRVFRQGERPILTPAQRLRAEGKNWL